MTKKIKTYVHCSKLTWREIEGEIVILNLDKDCYYTLSDVGAYIWMLLKTEKKTDQIVEMVAEKYKTSPDKIKNEIILFLEEMLQEELII